MIDWIVDESEIAISAFRQVAHTGEQPRVGNEILYEAQLTLEKHGR